jgi:hypothetical protein
VLKVRAGHKGMTLRLGHPHRVRGASPQRKEIKTAQLADYLLKKTSARVEQGFTASPKSCS